MGKPSRDKGARGELEIVRLLQASGWDQANRSFMSGASGGGDIVGGPDGYHVEVKRTETTQPWAWIEQCRRAKAPGEQTAIFFRRNNSPWHVIAEADSWVRLWTVEREMINRQRKEDASW
jgi:Holliday junction resolvase